VDFGFIILIRWFTLNSDFEKNALNISIGFGRNFEICEQTIELAGAIEKRDPCLQIQGIKI